MTDDTFVYFGKTDAGSCRGLSQEIPSFARIDGKPISLSQNTERHSPDSIQAHPKYNYVRSVSTWTNQTAPHSFHLSSKPKARRQADLPRNGPIKFKPFSISDLDGEAGEENEEENGGREWE